MIYNFYIFTRKGKCIFYKEWHRSNEPESLEEEQQLLFGLLTAIKSFVIKTSPSENETFHCYSTNTYKLHCFETATGLKFVINSDPKVSSLRDDLKKIYSDFYVEYVAKNPLYKIGDYINCSLFLLSVEKYIQNHKNYSKE